MSNYRMGMFLLLPSASSEECGGPRAGPRWAQLSSAV